MKYTHFKIGVFALALSGTLFFASCNRKDKGKDNDTELASDHNFSENTYNDVVNIADEASEKNTGENLENYKTASNCATITHDTTSTIRTITIDFGPTNCLCNDGRTRRGKILVSYTGRYRDAGSIHTITFDGYHVNDHHIMGSKTVTNAGLNAANQTYFTIVVNGLIVKSTGDSISWTSNRTRTWTQGESTIGNKMDDVYEITGSASGTKGSNSYTMTIIQPLVKSLACNWISAGIIELQPSGKALRTINFGTGNCDNIATVTIGGTVHTITLN